MKIYSLINQYIAYRKSLGETFRTNEMYLKAFCKAMGPDMEINQISEDAVNLFLYGKEMTNKITPGWFVKHRALLGFYQYAYTRGYAEKVPFLSILPKGLPAFVPYVYSKKELRQLFEAALCYQKNKSFVQPYMIWVILILLYSTGLRIREALSLKLSDMNLEKNLITVRSSKFYKSRLIPIGRQLAHILGNYLLWKNKRKLSGEPGSPLFVGKNNLPLNFWTMEGIFKRIRKKAGIIGNEDSPRLPRLHDLRHTFAVHHLISWYQEKKDVQKLLPILSTYMGHSYLACTTTYLSMTTDLLREAGLRFEEYAMGEQS